MKKMMILLYTALVFAVIFSGLNISFYADISVSAFPLAFGFTCILFYLSCISLLKRNNIKNIGAIRKLFQYEPFVFLAAFILRRSGVNGTSYLYDVLSVMSWVAITVLSFIILYFISEKRVYTCCAEWKKQRNASRSASVSGRGIYIIREAVDWIDALVQAVCMVLLIQIFVVQLYQIPSESMVPEFLIKDRVIVFKTASGPKFPLSDVGFPEMKTYHRGDIVVFRNPHYKMDRQSEVKTFVSQLVYMLSFTAVNLNTDTDGTPKADPLVKRVAGVPGEQLLLQDGILYVRTEDSMQFKPVTSETNWVAWNLNELTPDIKKKIRLFPLSQDQYKMMVDCEQQRRGLDIDAVKTECSELAGSFIKISGQQLHSGADMSGFFSKTDLFEYNLFRENEAVTRKLLTAAGGADWFSLFMTDWIGKTNAYSDTQNEITGSRLAGGDLYTDANFKLNLMIKLTLGRLIVRNAQLLMSGMASSNFDSDADRMEYMNQAEILNNYVLLLDRRNMPVFPANDAQGNAQYIPAHCYFMMGDNRFNSLDLRHSYNDTLVKLTPLDTYSITYYSNMSPQYVNRKLILGTTAFRFWPVNRIGKL